MLFMKAKPERYSMNNNKKLKIEWLQSHKTIISCFPFSLASLLTTLFLLTVTSPSFAAVTDLTSGVSNQPANCPTGYTNTGFTCFRPADTQSNGGSTVANCPSGYTNTGLTCFRPAATQSNGGSTVANCPSGYTNTGLTCLRPADTQSNGGSTVANCPSGYTNTGLTCFRGVSTTGCSTSSFGWCTSCPAGYSKAGLFCARGASTLGESFMTCAAGQFESAGRCFHNCPSGYTNTGVSCYRGPDTLGESAMTCAAGTFYSTGRCYLPCPSGYTNTGVSCYRGPDTLGESAMSCPTGQFESVGRCYLPCPTGYTNTGVSCYRGPDTLDASAMSCPSNQLLINVLIGGRCFNANSASINGSTPRPFWVYGHNPNTETDVAAALASGANALEPDVMVLPTGAYNLADSKADPTGLVVYHDNVRITTRMPMTLSSYMDMVRSYALKYPKLSLLAIDIKSPVVTRGDYGAEIVNTVHNHLLHTGQSDEIKLNIIYSVGTTTDSSIFAKMVPLLLSNEGIQIDGENSPTTMVKNFSTAYGPKQQNFAFGDGTLDANLSGIGPNTLTAIESAAYLRADSGLPKTSYAYSINELVAMEEYITTGVDAIITDNVPMLVNLVNNRSDIRLASRTDNPFTPLNQAYALKVVTANVAGAGTDAMLTFTLTGCKGSATTKVDASRMGRMEQGKTNYVVLPSIDLGVLTQLTVSRDDSGNSPDWNLSQVAISSNQLNHSTNHYQYAYFNKVISTTGQTASIGNLPCK